MINLVLLFNDLAEAMHQRRWARYPWAAMSHLTPSKMDVFLNPNEGFRELSHSIARNVSYLASHVMYVLSNKPFQIFSLLGGTEMSGGLPLTL